MAKQIVPKLDSGYGWLVAFACFSISFIMQGLARAAGVLYVAIIETYGVSREAATTPFSVRYGVRNMIGPIVGIIAQRYGMRTAVVIGGVFAGVGGALCSIAPDVLWITILWGIVHGIGYGLCNIIHILILNQYFDKYKATSIALALTGDCCGTFVFPSVLEFLLFNYDVNGTFLILGAISLNVVPAGLLMRAPDCSKLINEKNNKNITTKTLNDCHINGAENKAFEDSDIKISNLDPTNLEKPAIPKTKCNLQISSVKGYYFNNVLKNSDSKDFPLIDADKQKEIQQEKPSSKYSCSNDISNKESYFYFQTGDNRRRLNSIFPSSSTTKTQCDSLLEVESVEKQESNGKKVILLDQLDTEEKSRFRVSRTEEKTRTLQDNDIVLPSEIENSKQIDEIQKSTELILKPPAIQLENGQISDESSTKRKDSILDKILFLPAVVKSEIKDYKPLEYTNLNQSCLSGKSDFPSSQTKLENSSGLGGKLTFPMRKHSLSKFNSSQTNGERVSDSTATVTLDNESHFPKNTSISVQHDDCQVNVNLKGTQNAFRQFLNINIRPLLIVTGITLAAYSFSQIAIFTVIVDYASDKGMEMDLSNYLIISFSVADLFGRIGFGILLDKKWIKLSLYSGTNMTVMGISVLIIPLSSNYWYMMSCMFVFGLMQGGNAIAYSLLVEEYMNVGEENVALGCLNVYGGLIMLPLATVIGFFRDTIGNYDGVFYSASGMCLLAGILWVFEPLLLKIHQRLSIKIVK